MSSARSTLRSAHCVPLRTWTQPGSLPNDCWVRAKNEFLSFTPGYFRRAREQYQASLELWHKVADPEGELDALYHVGWIEYTLGESGKALSVTRHALETAREIKDSDTIAHMLTGLCIYETDAGSSANAAKYGQEAVERFRSLGDLQWQATALRCLGVSLLTSGHGDAARTTYQQVLAMQREVGDRIGESDTDSFLSHVEFQLRAVALKESSA